MGWMQCSLSDPGHSSGITEKTQALLEAEGQGAPATDVALFSRQDRESGQTVYLLSPAAAGFASQLPGEWADVSDPFGHGWALCAGSVDAFQRLGVKTTRELAEN